MTALNGNLHVTGTTSTGDFDTYNITGDASNGNTAVDGTLNVKSDKSKTNKFVVTALNGNTAILVH